MHARITNSTTAATLTGILAILSGGGDAAAQQQQQGQPAWIRPAPLAQPPATPGASAQPWTHGQQHGQQPTWVQPREAAPRSGPELTVKVHEPPTLSWKPAPGMPPGAEFAELHGGIDLRARGADGLSITRFKFPDNYRIPPHSHPADEHMTVISGTFIVGMGEKPERANMREMKAGTHVVVPAGAVHYVLTSGETVVQRTKTGAWSIKWVDPADASLR